MDRAALRAAAHGWARAWARGWATHDVDLIRSLYAHGARFLSEPFRPPREPGDYAKWAFEDEAAAETWFAEPVVDGDRAVVAWWAISRSRDGGTVTLAGSSHLRFDAGGRVADQRDYWNEADGAHPPPEDWGPVAAHEGEAATRGGA